MTQVDYEYVTTTKSYETECYKDLRKPSAISQLLPSLCAQKVNTMPNIG